METHGYYVPKPIAWILAAIIWIIGLFERKR